MDNFVSIVAFLLLGVLLRRIRSVPARTGTVLNSVVIHVSLPALVLLMIPRMALSGDVLIPALMPWAMLAFSVAAVLVLSGTLGWDRGTTGCLLLMATLGNTSFLGIPMVKAFFGDAGVPYAVLYDQLGSFPSLAVYGTLIVSIYGTGSTGASVGGVARRVVTFPPFIALVVALALKGTAYPAPAVAVLAALAATLVPLVMIAVGFQLDLRAGREHPRLIGVGLAIKMVAAPLLALGLCRLFGFGGDAARVAVFEAGMPPMVTAGVLAISAGLSPALTAALVGFGIAASFLTLPLLYQLL